MATKVVEIDTRNFSKMVKDLAFIKGKDLQTIIRGETKAILEKSIRSTKAAKVSKIRKRVNSASWVTVDGKRYNIGKWRIPARIMKRIKEIRKNKITKRLAMRGMAKGTFYNIARQLGLDVNAPGYVKSAAQSSRASLGAALSGTANGTTRYTITIRNASIVAMKYQVGGFRAFKRAINGRVAYFDKQMKFGFKAQVEKAVRGRAKVT